MIEECCHEEDLYRVRSMVTFCCAAAAAGLTMQSVGLSRRISGGVRPRYGNAYKGKLCTIFFVSGGCTGTTSRDQVFSFGVDRLFWVPITDLLQARRLDGGITKRGSDQPHGQGCYFDSYHFGLYL